MKILMVCLGNICRSPLAEGILLEKIRHSELDWQVDSAGTNGFHVNEPPHRSSQKVAREHGIDISMQRARKFVKDDFDKYDKIYAMAGDVLEEMQAIAGSAYDSKKVELLLNELYPGEDRDVPDPWYSTEAAYYEVFSLIESACEAIVAKYTKNIENYQIK